MNRQNPMTRNVRSPQAHVGTVVPLTPARPTLTPDQQIRQECETLKNWLRASLAAMDLFPVEVFCKASISDQINAALDRSIRWAQREPMSFVANREVIRCLLQRRALQQSHKDISLSSMAVAIDTLCDTVQAKLLEKNTAYGNSVLDPVRLFCKSDRIQQINVRLDDKISRIKRGHALSDESLLDTEFDMLGYLILKSIALRAEAETWKNES